jgi:hypothetical protein
MPVLRRRRQRDTSDRLKRRAGQFIRSARPLSPNPLRTHCRAVGRATSLPRPRLPSRAASRPMFHAPANPVVATRHAPPLRRPGSAAGPGSAGRLSAVGAADRVGGGFALVPRRGQVGRGSTRGAVATSIAAIEALVRADDRETWEGRLSDHSIEINGPISSVDTTTMKIVESRRMTEFGPYISRKGRSGLSKRCGPKTEKPFNNPPYSPSSGLLTPRPPRLSMCV